MTDSEGVRKAAARFRCACETLTEIDLYTFLEFPTGACGDASVLVGQYLQDCGFGVWTYRCGDNGRGSHAWIEQDGLIVDITADQFPGVSEPVIVTKDPGWHSQFNRMAGGDDPANLISYQWGKPRTAACLLEAARCR